MALTAPKSLRDPSPLAGEDGRGGHRESDASGNAFPHFRTDAWHRPIIHGGMTKREWYAGMALAGIISSGPHACDHHEIAHYAVAQADAMVAALAAKAGPR